MCQNFGFAQRRRRSRNAIGTIQQLAAHWSRTRYLPVKPECFAKAVVQPLFKNACWSRLDPVSGKPVRSTLDPSGQWALTDLWGASLGRRILSEAESALPVGCNEEVAQG